MSHDKLHDYLKYRNIIKSLLLIVGLWPAKDPKLLYRILPYPFLLVNLCVTFGTGFYVKNHRTNVAAITKGLSLMTSFLTIFLKMMCVMINHDKYCELHVILDHHFSNLLNNQQTSTSILKNLRSFRRLSWALIFLVTIVTLLTAGTPIISIIFQHLHSVDSIVYPHFYPTAYPYPLNPPGFRYKIHFLIEFAATVPFFCVSPSIDSLFMMYGFQMIGQFREMSNRILHIDQVIDDKNVVKECVLQHESMLRCLHILQNIFGPILLWVMATNAISLCSLIFQLTQIKSMTISTILIFATYISFKILQTFTYAYTGTCLTTESESYQKAIYNANWQRNKRLMTSILIMLTQKPIILTACNFSTVSLNIFVKVLNTTMSYFFLLRTVS